MSLLRDTTTRNTNDPSKTSNIFLPTTKDGEVLFTPIIMDGQNNRVVVNYVGLTMLAMVICIFYNCILPKYPENVIK